MRGWIRSQQASKQAPTCPVCRSGGEFSGLRLQEFLDNPEASGALSEEERGFFENVAEGLSDT